MTGIPMCFETLRPYTQEEIDAKLKRAMKMKDHEPRLLIPFGPIKGIEWTTDHCIIRFRERAKVTGTAGEVLRKLEQWITQARPAQLKPGKGLLKMLNNGCKSANYWLMGSTKKGAGFVLVVVGNKLVTVHRNDSGEWRIPADEPA